jgi:hypothetical protein
VVVISTRKHIELLERPRDHEPHRAGREPGAARGGDEPEADLAAPVALVERVQQHHAGEGVVLVGDRELEAPVGGRPLAHARLVGILLRTDQPAELGILLERRRVGAGVAGPQAAQRHAVTRERGRELDVHARILPDRVG